MLHTGFGIELEFTGISRDRAACVLRRTLGGTITYLFDRQDTIEIAAPDHRKWKIMNDGSINPQKKSHGETIAAGSEYRAEMVSPILTYDEDIQTLQMIVRELRHAGAFANCSCGIHIHLDGENHTPQSVWNMVNIIASRNDLFYKALQIPPDRMRYCKKMDAYMVRRLNQQRPKSFSEISDIWYSGYDGCQTNRYNKSRYQFLNLHCFFNGNHTLELRGFNATLHAGEVRAYVALALAINHQALSQKYARYRYVQEENEKFAMRVYLVRIGLSGDQFRSCRKHLCKHLSGNAAWRYGSKDNCIRHNRRTSAGKE